MIHRAEFDVIEAKPEFMHPCDYLEVTCQYNVLFNPADKNICVDVSQIVPAKGVDRFQIIFGLDNQPKWTNSYRQPENYGISYSDRQPENYRFSSRGKDRIFTRLKLRLVYNEDKILESAPFYTEIWKPDLQKKATKIAGLRLDDKINLLYDKDIDVVRSIIDTLVTIGTKEVLQALREKAKRMSKPIYELDYAIKQLEYREGDN